ncbi:hypothetical protein SLS53_008861 [Cytospora paraplurivora]|uniref:Heterokaryon incompatibility domain-containing protein n=1 Tax=Cytospora paraplurivora TaxID=2898453 RepID=A0AAN9TX57_9PEZI
MSTTPTETVFQHEPLPDRKWIRLITIDPDLVDGNIACTLHLFDGTSRPKYVALSYLWGDPAPKHTIYINGMTRRIHENLWQFLHRSWRQKATEYFWIDSICLDQDSHSELNEQVQLMGDIYYQAHHVLSWLGEHPLDIEALQIMVEYGNDPLELELLDNDRMSESDRAQNPIFVWWAFKRLSLGTTYWERVWVLQEVICAKHCSVVCGPVQIDFEDLISQLDTANNGLEEWARQGEDLGLFKLASLRTALKSRRRLHILRLVTMSSGCKSTREVDQVYGLLGLASRFDPDFDSQALKVDYDKTLHQVSWDVACLCTETVHGLGSSRRFDDIDFHDLIEFLCSMPVFQDHESTLAERAVTVGAHLEAYSIAPATPGNWRRQAQVARKVYQAIASTWRYANSSWIRLIWEEALSDALRKAVGCRHSACMKGCFTGNMRVEPEPSGPEAGPICQSQGLILGLSLLACAFNEKLPSSKDKETQYISPSSHGWFCAAHMSRHQVAEALRVIPFEFNLRRGKEVQVGMICAASSETCDYSTFSLSIADEGLILEVIQNAEP